MKKSLITLVICIIAAAALVGSFIFLIYARSAGKEAGTNIGSAVGLAVGAFDGFTKGISEALKRENSKA